MAIILSDLMKQGAVPYQSIHQGEEDSVTAVVKISAGQQLLANDVIKLARIFPNVPLDEITIRSDDLDSNGTPTLSASLGYVRAVRDPSLAYNASSNPTVTDSIGADSAAFYAATSVTPYQAGGVNRYVRGQAALDNEFANNGPVAGYNDLALTVTANAATAPVADSYIYVTFKYIGLTPAQGNNYGY